MHYQKQKSRGQLRFRWLAILLAVTLVVTMCPPLQYAAYGATKTASSALTTETPEILVSGTKVIGAEEYTSSNISLEKAYTRAELKAMSGVKDASYSAINTKGTQSYYKATGVYVESLLNGTAFDAAKDKLLMAASDGYTASFDPKASYKNGSSDTTGLNVKRYYYPTAGSEAGKQEVKTILSWANTSGTKLPDSAGSDKGYCTVITGQISADDQNNPLYNKNMARIIGGSQISGTAITIDGKSYSRGDILLMDRAENSYTYSTKGGTQTDYVRGVPMSVILKSCKDDSVVEFAAADGYEVDASGKTVKELIDGNYILAYEKGTSRSDLAGIYATAKNDANIKGYFTLYGNDGTPAKMISSITISDASGNSYANSPYKHITNGGNKDSDGPYDIDGITGATLTVEGPGVKNSVPVSVRDLEGQNNGAFRGNYKDQRSGQEKEFTYEGIDLYYILHNMASGDSGIILTDKARKVQIKNRNRKTIASFTLDQIKSQHDKGRPILVAYGTSDTQGKNIRPFVYDNGVGADKSLGNEDGCLKLVYDKSTISGDTNQDYTKFSNMAYIYVAEDSSPGFKHDKEPYNTAENSQYVLTVTGEQIGREVNYTVEQLENMVEYDKTSNAPVSGGIGYRDEYSLANSSYWYVNEYEGVKLWDLLLKSGLSKSKASDSKTKVTFSATDGYTAFDEFSLKQIADPASFGYYEKNAEDNNDGKYVPKADDLKKTGYPVLVAYGVNGYPYVIHNELDGYLSGLQNDGGPLRIISGKTQYSHANGSNQAKLLDKVLVGEDKYHYSTHKYHSKDVYKKQADQTLSVKVYNGSDADAPVLKDKNYTVGDVEDVVYSGKLTKAELEDAKVKGFYEVAKNGSMYSDLYEGVNLTYFLEKVVEIPGQKGTITFSDGKKELKLNLSDVLQMNSGYNSTTKMDDLSPVLAFGKNGSPMVASKDAQDGYEDTVTLEGGQQITVKNNGGPLSVLIPSSSKEAQDAQSLTNVTSITINLSPDNYAHVKAPYDTYQNSKIKVSGEGTRISGEKEFTLAELEGKQTLAVTGDYSILKKGASSASQQRYRGIDLYEFLKSTAVGLKNNADKVIITCADGSKKEFSLSEVRKSDYINSVTKAKDLKMILAYGSAAVTNSDREDGKPLVKDASSTGYVKAYDNSGGPVKLVTGQTDAADVNSSKILKNVTAIEVTASEMESWNHSSSEVFKQYLKDTLTLQVVSEDGTVLHDKAYTVEELEAMTDLIERDEITGTSTNSWEGINFWGFVRQETAAIAGMDDPITVTVSAKDGFSKELRSIFGMDGLENGIKDGQRRVPIILGYGMDGYPLSSGSKSNPNGEGYDSVIGNNGGPIRLMTHGNQGACLQETVKIVVKVKDSGQPAEAVKFNVSAADGKTLPQAGVRAVKFDKDGGMWIGTYGGGAAYKAKGADKFTIYNKSSSPALETGFVSALAPDADGGVWMSQNASYTDQTANKGVIYLRDGKITSYRASDSPATIPDDYVQDIKIDDKGCVWFASFGGLTKYDPSAGTWKTWNKNDGFPAMSADRIEFDGNGGVWVGFYPDGKGTADDPFTGGFAHIDQNGKITAYPETASVDTASGQSKLAEVWIRDIAVDKNGAAWITASGAYANIENTGGTLWYVKSPGAEAKKYTGDSLFGKALNGADNAEIRMVEADADGGLWFGTSADGIFHVADPVIQEDGTFKLTAEYSKETGSWSDSLLNNIYSLDVAGSVVYAGGSGGLAWVDYLAADGKTNVGDASAGDCDIAFTGEGLTNNGFFTIKGLKNAKGIEKLTKTYKWRNSKGTEGTSEVEGAYVENIFKDVLGLEKNASDVTLIAADGYKTTMTLEELFAQDIEGLKPMLAWKEDGEKVNPKLVIGQKNAEDSNKSQWLRDIVKVVVSAEDTPAPQPQKPDPIKKKLSIKAASAGTYSVKVKWSKAAGASKYVLYKATSKNGKYKKTAVVKSNSYTVKKLKAGKKYYFKVRAYKVTGGKTVYGPYTKSVSAVPRPAVPTVKLKAGKSKIRASWKTVKNIDGYVVYRAKGTNGKYKKVASLGKKAKSYTDKKLSGKTTYKYRIKAYKKAGGKYVYSKAKTVKVKTK